MFSLGLKIIPNGSETTFSFNCLYLSLIFLRASPLQPYDPKQLADNPLWITGFNEVKIVQIWGNVSDNNVGEPNNKPLHWFKIKLHSYQQ